MREFSQNEHESRRAQVICLTDRIIKNGDMIGVNGESQSTKKRLERAPRELLILPGSTHKTRREGVAAFASSFAVFA